MRKSIFVISIIIAWFIAVMYDLIDKMTDVKIDALLYAAIAIMIVGLFGGLHANNKGHTKEEL